MRMRIRRLACISVATVILTLIVSPVVSAASEWVSPTSVNDVGNKYTNEANIIDGNISTYATVQGSEFVDLYLNISATHSTKFRVCQQRDGNLPGPYGDLTVIYQVGYSDGTWSSNYSVTSNLSWVEQEITEGNVVSLRILNSGVEAPPDSAIGRMHEVEIYRHETAGATILDYLPIVIGLAIFMGIFAAIKFRNPLVVVGVILVTSLLGLAAIMIINAFHGSELLW